VLPALVIGLREGLETVVVIGAIVVFVRAQGRQDLLPRIWRACGVAVAACVAFGLIVRYIEVSLPWRRQEQFETVIGMAAVATVTYMVIWMRRFPKDLRRRSETEASAALQRSSGRGLVVMAFFAVLREGFEITVFLVATIGLTGRSAWLSTGGALLGVVVAVAIGVGLVRGTTQLDVARFFRITALVLVVSAAGIAMTTVHTANAAGWITFGQRPQFDLSWLAPSGSVLSSFTTGMFGLQPYPVLIEVVVWLAYVVPMTAVVLWPRRDAASVSRRRQLAIGATGCLLVATGVGAGVALPSASSPAKQPVVTNVLFSTLDSVACVTGTDCEAVGDFLALDKDGAVGDPDGDGKAARTLVESYDGHRWVRDPSPDLGRGGDQLSSVSCPATGYCTAVGFYRPDPFPASAKTAPPEYPLIESVSGGRWHLATGPQVAPNSVLVSVSCPERNVCVAVGYTTTQVGDNAVESLLMERFNGQTWSAVPLAVPTGYSSALNSVSCPSVSYCVAVGETAPASDPSATHPLAEIMTGDSWDPVALPPAGNGQGILYGVVCPASGHCMAVGNVVTGPASGAPLVLSLDGPAWGVDSSALQTVGDASLTALGCPPVGGCVTAGTLLESSQRVLAMVNDNGWMALAGPPYGDNIDAITCPTTTSCLVVGNAYVDGFGNTTALIASVAQDQWVTQRAAQL
jgi:high-affinity iron transporter